MATAIGSSWTKLVEYTSTATYSVTYRLYAKYSASSIANNTHTIQLKWTTQKTSGGTGVYDNDSTTPKVTNISNGNPTSWTGTAFTIPSGSAVAETDRTTSGNIVITHNSNGTYSATWSWSLSHVYEGGSKSGTVAVTLPTIPRASSFTLSDSNIYTNQTTTATITRADSSFTHNITTTYSGTSYTLASGVGTSASLSIPTGIRTAMKSANAKSATLTLTLTTLSGSTTIGTATTSLTITVPTATVTVTPSSVACNSATTKWTLGNVDTTACTYTVQRLYGSTVRYTDQTKATATTKSSLANALFEANITSATSGTVTVRVTTYVGTTTVGSNTVTYTVTIPTGTYKPSITFNSATRTGSTYGSIAYLAGYNGAKATFTTSVNGSSAIDSRSVIITNNITSTSLSYSGNTITVTTGTFPSNSSNYSVTITVTVRDKRGTSASASTTLTISGYAKPSVTATATRANSGGTADTEGTYANLTATGKAHTNASIASMQIKYGSTSVKTATSATVTQNAYGGSFAVTNSYTFTAIATDNLGFSTTISFVLASASYVLSLHPNGGVGMGTVASANRVDIAYKQVTNHFGNSGAITVSNTAYRIGLHIGSGGVTRGIYDFGDDSDGTTNSGLNKWLLYTNNTNTYINPGTSNIILNGNTQIDGTTTAKGEISFDTRAHTQISGVDQLGQTFTLINHNGSNIWIGSSATSAQHHAGGTYISAGYNYDSDTKEYTSGKTSIYISVPTSATTATNYLAYHDNYHPLADTATTATTATNATNATYSTKTRLYTARQTSANLTASGVVGVSHFIATVPMTTGKPTNINGTAFDAHILHFAWDNAGGWDSQLAIAGGSYSRVVVRTGTGTSGNYTEWQEIPVTKNLYSNDTGTTGNVTLRETSANFDYLDIYYYSVPSASTSTIRYGYTRVYAPNGKTVTLANTVYWSNYLEITNRTIVISGTSITNASNEQAQFRFTNGSSPTRSSTSSLIYITRVDGIR